VITAADASLARKDEVYIVTRDDAYDSSGYALPSLAVRTGTAAGTPAAPGPDAAWDAYLLLATIDVPASAADILACTITDNRVYSGIVLGGIDVLERTDGTGTSVGADTGETVALKVGGVAELEVSATQVDAKSNDFVNVGDINGLTPEDWSLDTHDHDADYAALAGGNTITGDQDITGQVKVDAPAQEAVVIEAETGEARGVRIEEAGGTETGYIGSDTSDNMEVTAQRGDLELSATGSVKAGGTRVLTTADEGSGNGIDADTLDAYEAAAFALLAGAVFTGQVKTDGSVTDPLVVVREAGEARVVRYENLAGTVVYADIGIETNDNLQVQNLTAGADLLLATNGGTIKAEGVEVATITQVDTNTTNIATNTALGATLLAGKLSTVNDLSGNDITASSSAPSGGVDGDIHLRYA
jgi:hypothetical protein